MPIPKNFSTNIKITAKEKALNQLQRWIIEGTLVSGEKLIENELSEALGVSRTPVREALQILEMQGFVTILHGRETSVTKIEKQDIVKIYQPFAALQSLAAELAATNVSKTQIEKLNSINTEFLHLLNNGQSYKAMELDEEFHNLIVDIADNSYIMNFNSTLQMHIRRFKYLFLSKLNVSEISSYEEHKKLISAFEEQNSLMASQIMKQNVLRPMQELYEHLEESSQ